MIVLITHEESQTVMEAFLLAGHDAYSNDLLPCSGKYPERHLQMDCFEAIKLIKPDFLGMHPECTRLTVTANKWYKPEYAERFPNIHQERAEAVDHFMQCVEAVKQVGKGYLENPIGIMSTRYRKPEQVIQPYQFGSPTRKATCLWIFGLPNLKPTDIVKHEIFTFKSGKTMSMDHYKSSSLTKEERRGQLLTPESQKQWQRNGVDHRSHNRYGTCADPLRVAVLTIVVQLGNKGVHAFWRPCFIENRSMNIWKVTRWFYKGYWKYLLEKPCTWKKFRCRIGGHKCGPIYYNVAGTEPDDRCINCRDHI